jgi:hypothetical protein
MTPVAISSMLHRAIDKHTGYSGDLDALRNRDMRISRSNRRQPMGEGAVPARRANVVAARRFASAALVCAVVIAAVFLFIAALEGAIASPGVLYASPASETLCSYGRVIPAVIVTGNGTGLVSTRRPIGLMLAACPSQARR